MVNVFALRATDVNELRTAPLSAAGPRNDEAVLAACRLPRALVVCAWGSRAKLPPSLRARLFDFTLWLRRAGVALHAFRLTAAGDPEHPLYLPATCRPEVWRG